MRTKKSYLAVLLVLCLALSTGFAFADEPQQAAGQPAPSGQKIGPKKFDPAAVAKFHKQTLEQRKKLAGARAAFRALMKQDTPDVAKVRALAEEIFELREQVRTKALENGLPPFFGQGHKKFGRHGKRSGCGPMGKRPSFGPRGKGPGCGPHWGPRFHGRAPGCGQHWGPGFGPQCGRM